MIFSVDQKETNGMKWFNYMFKIDKNKFTESRLSQ